jgi:molybdopterin synthase catalytic subunit
MRIKIAYFAACREAAGCREEHAELSDGAQVSDAVAWICGQHAGIERIIGSVRVAVNQEFAGPDQPLSDGDEVVLIPPVSGGSGERVRLCETAIEVGAARDLLEATGYGALATFAGVVRPTSKSGRAVTELFYEAYTPMAVAKIQQCLDEAHARWELLDAAAVHRLGLLGLGDVAVSIAVLSKHRKEAFAACSYIIDRIKEIVPIWKKETGPDGSEWVSEGA